MLTADENRTGTATICQSVLPGFCKVAISTINANAANPLNSTHFADLSNYLNFDPYLTLHAHNIKLSP